MSGIPEQREKIALTVGLTTSIEKGRRAWFWGTAEDTGHLACANARKIYTQWTIWGSWPIPETIAREGLQQTPDALFVEMKGPQGPREAVLEERANVWGICYVITECERCSLFLFAHLPISPTSERTETTQ